MSPPSLLNEPIILMYVMCYKSPSMRVKVLSKSKKIRKQKKCLRKWINVAKCVYKVFLKSCEIGKKREQHRHTDIKLLIKELINDGKPKDDMEKRLE